MYNKSWQGLMKHLDFIILDLLVTQFAFVIAYWLRHEIRNPYHKNTYFTGGLVLVLAGLLCAFFFDNYKNILKRDILKEAKAVLQMVFSYIDALLAYLFFSKTSKEFSRSVVFYFAVLAALFLLTERSIWKKWIIGHRSRSIYNKRHMLLVTEEAIAENVIQTIKDNSFGEIEIIGLVLADGKDVVGEERAGVPIATTMDQLVPYVKDLWIDEIMFYLSNVSVIPEGLLGKCSVMGITTHVGLNFDTDRKVMQTIERIGGYPVLTESIHIAPAGQLLLKRLMDIAGSIVGLFFTAIFTVIFGPMIYFADPGPIFFAQKRVGQNGRVFTMYKFRSMYKDAEQRKKELMEKNEIQGLMFKIENDPRILGSGPDGSKKGIGWFIRKTSIDEFPQFLNVLLGQCSLVGTRPCLLDEWEAYELHHRARMAIRPGLTGMWQVSGRSDIKDFEKVVELDMEYINNWSIEKDIEIILKTIGLLFSGNSGAH